jgi:NAD-specific glutamate dehydrogenase
MDNEQIERYKKAGFTQAIAEQICFIEGIEDFPYLLALVDEIQQSFTDTIQMCDELNDYLRLTEVYNLIEDIQIDDYWEEKVRLELLYGMKQITGNIVKEIHREKLTCADYFSDDARIPALQQYQSVYQKTNSLSSAELMPYIALKSALEKLI